MLHGVLFRDCQRTLYFTAIFAVFAIDTMAVPVITKYQGILLPLYAITFFAALRNISGLFQIFLNKIPLPWIYTIAVGTDILLTLSLATYFHEEYLFIVSASFFAILQFVFYQALDIQVCDYFHRRHSDLKLKDFLVAQTFVYSAGSLAGGLLGSAISLSQADNACVIWSVILLNLLMLPVQFQLLRSLKAEPTVCTRNQAEFSPINVHS